MGVGDAKRLKTLEQDNGTLRKLLVERMLDIEVLKDINAKNGEGDGVIVTPFLVVALRAMGRDECVNLVQGRTATPLRRQPAADR